MNCHMTLGVLESKLTKEMEEKHQVKQVLGLCVGWMIQMLQEILHFTEEKIGQILNVDHQH